MAPLYARIIGEGIPVIIVHGWEMNGVVEATDFEPIFQHISGFKRIYLDLPGMGNSPIDGAQDLDDMYQRLHDSIRTIVATEYFLLIGSSCGAYLCRALVHDFAAQIDGVLLRVPLIEPDNARRDLDVTEVLVQNAVDMARLSESDATLFEHAAIQTREYLELKRERVTLATAAVAMSNGAALARIRNDTSKYRLLRSMDAAERFTAPALIMCGRHDGVVGYRDAWKLMERYPRASFVVLDRAGHDMPVDELNLFASLVQDWLKRVLEYRSSRTARDVKS